MSSFHQQTAASTYQEKNIMGKKYRSAKGELVDFDLLRIKQQMSAGTPPVDVQTRKDFIDRRLRRRLKKTAPPAPKIHKEQEEEKEQEVKQQATEEKQAEEKVAENEEENNKTEPKTTKKKKTARRQKARPKTDK